MRKHWANLPILILLACAAALLSPLAYDRDGVAARLLRPSALDRRGGGNATAVTVTIHIADLGPGHGHDQSVFYTDVLARYGSGRVGYRVEEHRRGDLACRAAAPLAHDATTRGGGPCLAVTRRRTRRARAALGCNFPRCRTMVTNDELCRARGDFDARTYRAAAAARPAAYLPLGPRRDAWRSLRERRGAAGFVPRVASERRYAFNAVFSVSTHKTRGKLAGVLASRAAADPLPAFANLAEEWTAAVDDPRSQQLDSRSYATVLLDSAFTLAPAGHNPECFRLFEAADAGSIPVLLRADLHGGPRRCGSSLEGWRDAPLLVLESWSDLHSAIGALVADPAALDARQERLRGWYEGYMRRIVAEFEDFVAGEGGAGDSPAEALMDHTPKTRADKERRKR